MSLYNFHNFPAAGIGVPSESPFFPHIKGYSVRFNQGFVFDYQKMESGVMVTLPVTMADSYDLAEGSSFHIQITTPENSAQVYDASVIQAPLPNSMEDFHYSAENISLPAPLPEDAPIEGDPYLYLKKEGRFIIPMCDLQQDPLTSRWEIGSIYVRENIHWQKINFANTVLEDGVAESLGVLRNWGEASQFLNNPNVEFKRIVQKASGLDPIIKIENSPNGENIVVTTQLPQLPDANVILQRFNNEWQWVPIPTNTVPESGVAESIGVLKNWGDQNIHNPNVEFKRIVQKASGLDPIIKIENSPNGENIVVTTQFPPLPDGYNVILQRYNDEWQWVQIPPNCYVISSPFSEVFFDPMITKSTPYIDQWGGFQQLPFPTEAAVIADGPHVLHSDGNTIYWAPIDVYY